jgi:hypothetical protein
MFCGKTSLILSHRTRTDDWSSKILPNQAPLVAWRISK